MLERTERKKTDVFDSLRRSNTSVYSLTGPPTRPGCPLSSHPKTSTLYPSGVQETPLHFDYTARPGKCARILGSRLVFCAPPDAWSVGAGRTVRNAMRLNPRSSIPTLQKKLVSTSRFHPAVCVCRENRLVAILCKRCGTRNISPMPHRNCVACSKDLNFKAELRKQQICLGLQARGRMTSHLSPSSSASRKSIPAPLPICRCSPRWDRSATG